MLSPLYGDRSRVVNGLGQLPCPYTFRPQSPCLNHNVSVCLEGWTSSSPSLPCIIVSLYHSATVPSFPSLRVLISLTHRLPYFPVSVGLHHSSTSPLLTCSRALISVFHRLPHLLVPVLIPVFHYFIFLISYAHHSVTVFLIFMFLFSYTSRKVPPSKSKYYETGDTLCFLRGGMV